LKERLAIDKAIKVTRVFEDIASAYLSGRRGILLEGGTSSTKTWSVLQFLHLVSDSSKERLVTSVISESLPHLKLGCIRDFFNIISESQDSNPKWSKTEFAYRYPKAVIEFWGADNEGKARGPRRDILFVNEGNHVPWSTVESAEVRTSRFVIVDWNPSEEFWVHQYESGGQRVQGWLHDSRFAYSHSTYLDARDVLPISVVNNIESKKDKDPNWWNIYGLGLLGKIEGLVHPYFQQVDELPIGAYHYWLDFGFGGDPAAFGKSVIIGSNLYSRELIYETGLTNDDIARRMDLLGVGSTELIVADSAEPKSIEEIRRKNFNIIPAPKGPGSLEYGIQKVNQYYQFWTKDSVNAIKEQRNYRYPKNKMTGQLENEPIDDFNHCMDGRRYGVMGYRLGSGLGLPGNYTGRGIMSNRR